MYLSRIQLDPQRRETMRAYSEPQRLHGAVERCFSQRQQRLLWRIDWLQGRCYLLMVSGERPAFVSMADQFGFSADANTWQTKDYMPFLQHLQAGQRWRFRLVANPIISKVRPQARGRVEALAGREAQRAWLMRQQERLGIILEEDGYDIVHAQWLRFRKGDGNQVSIRAVAYEGLLKVEQADSLRAALTQGVGRGKAYGLGMMTVIPVLPP